MPREQYGFCRTPSEIDLADMVGTWSAKYEDHWVYVDGRSSPLYMRGMETLVLSADGSYTHTYENDGAFYLSDPARWSLNGSALDSPKLVMEGMRYFAAGELTDGLNAALRLGPGKADRLDFQGKLSDSEFVNYPADGYIYLYVRRCSRELVLQHMMFNHIWDPDDLFIPSPMFHNERHKPIFDCLIPIDWCLDL